MAGIKTVPITLITGYLGSGKTTLVNHILRNSKNHKMAVIVNDLGEVNIDAELIAKEGIVSGKDDNLVALQNGCICCTLKKDLINQLADLVQSQKFDHIIIEASGSNGIGQRFTSVAELEGKAFAIVNEDESKALYGTDNQNLAYDVYEKQAELKMSFYLWDSIICEIEQSEDDTVVVDRDYNVPWNKYFLYSGLEPGEEYAVSLDAFYDAQQILPNVYYKKKSITVNYPR